MKIKSEVIMGVLTFIAIMLILAAFNGADRVWQDCNKEYATVTGIKDVDKSFLSSARCIYETDKGDIYEICTYDVGDEILINWWC